VGMASMSRYPDLYNLRIGIIYIDETLAKSKKHRQEASAAV
jgi:hypothetical protein